MVLFFSFIAAMLVTMALIPPLMRMATRLQIVDLPNERKVHCVAIPRVGGLAMVAGAVLPLIVWLWSLPQVMGLLMGIAVIVAFGVWDDRADLDYRLKFAGQCIAALVVWWMGVRVEELPWIGEIAPFWSMCFTVLALLAVTNAVNLADGLDGLAGGSTLLSLAAIAVLGYIANHMAVVLIALAVMGSILGFLRFNTHPACVFMGDGGSQFLGFSTGVLAILLTQGEGHTYSTSLPFLLLGLPLFDTLLVIVQRLRERRSPFSPDRNHIHHRLLAAGLDHYQAVFVIYVVQALLVIAAYYLRDAPDDLILLCYSLCCAAVVALLAWARAHPFHSRAVGAAPATAASRLLAFTGERATRWGVLVAATSMPLYLGAGILLGDAPGVDMAWLAGGLILMLALWSRRGRTLTWLERCGIYLAGALALYLVQRSGLTGGWSVMSNVYFALLAVTVVVAFRCARDRRFAATPLDFLVIFLVVVFPQIPGLEIGYAQDLTRLVVLFYAIELVLTQSEGRGHAVRGVTCLLLCLPLLRLVV